MDGPFAAAWLACLLALRAGCLGAFLAAVLHRVVAAGEHPGALPAREQPLPHEKRGTGMLLLLDGQLAFCLEPLDDGADFGWVDVHESNSSIRTAKALAAVAGTTPFPSNLSSSVRLSLETHNSA